MATANLIFAQTKSGFLPVHEVLHDEGSIALHAGRKFLLQISSYTHVAKSNVLSDVVVQPREIFSSLRTERPLLPLCAGKKFLLQHVAKSNVLSDVVVQPREFFAPLSTELALLSFATKSLLWKVKILWWMKLHRQVHIIHNESKTSVHNYIYIGVVMYMAFGIVAMLFFLQLSSCSGIC